METLAVQRPVGVTMNRTRVIVTTTVAVFVILCTITVLFFRAIPPWPMLLWFAVSHAFFCIVIARAKPYRGPYNEPMIDAGTEPPSKTWAKPPAKPGQR